jgi:thioredoxin-like negative regulator of GroEL
LGLTWSSGTLDDALAKAKANKKFVLIDVYATWCGPCHEMDDKVYSRDEVAKAVDSQWVALRRDGERDEGLDIAGRYHVVGFPTLLLLDDSGKEIDRLMGFVQPKDLIAQLAKLRTGAGSVAEMEKKLAASPRDEALRLEVGTRHAMRGDARAVAELTSISDAKRAPAALLTLGKYYYLRGQKDHVKAEATLRELERRFPASEEAGQVGYNLALALHGQKKLKETRQVLDAWIAAAPKDVSRYNSYAWLCFKNAWEPARGIEVARLGLELDPKEHGLWDTLAELYFTSGKADDARKAEERALAIKPNDAYYTAQLRRFGGAK